MKIKDKKVVAIVTIFDNFNNGTYLQAFATSYMVRKLGYKVLFVDYCREFNKYTLFWQHLWRNPLKQFFAFIGFVKRRKAMQSIVRSNFTLTNPYVGYQSLEKNPPKADIYLTGSDQVWNTLHNHGIDKAYYWGEINDASKKIISYAASIGLDKFDEQDQEQIYALLSRYSAISVREQNAVSILKNLGLDSTLVLDPTLLLSKSEWLEALKLDESFVSSPYILYYSVETSEQDKLLEEMARQISQHLGIPIIQMCFGSMSKKNYVSQYVENPLPQDFISLMAHASFVIACSFHGTAFSLNFNKPFVSIVPVKYSSRAVSLLNEFGLSEHFITEKSQIDCSKLCNIDYKRVNGLLDEKRISSIDFLRKALS